MFCVLCDCKIHRPIYELAGFCALHRAIDLHCGGGGGGGCAPIGSPSTPGLAAYYCDVCSFKQYCDALSMRYIATFPTLQRGNIATPSFWRNIATYSLGVVFVKAQLSQFPDLARYYVFWQEVILQLPVWA